MSCIELHGFSELTPWQLAFVLSLDMQQMKEQDELSLFVCCKREKLLSYLFDVEESETVLKTKLDLINPILDNCDKPVSYTHLDVYKRQILYPLRNSQAITV